MAAGAGLGLGAAAVGTGVGLAGAVGGGLASLSFCRYSATLRIHPNRS